MNVSVKLVLGPSAVRILRDEDISGEQSAAAPAADSATAAVPPGHTCTFQGKDSGIALEIRNIFFPGQRIHREPHRSQTADA